MLYKWMALNFSPREAASFITSEDGFRILRYAALRSVMASRPHTILGEDGNGTEQFLDADIGLRCNGMTLSMDLGYLVR